MTQTFFTHFRCRALSSEKWVVDYDYSIECFPDEFGVWWLFAILSFVGIVFVSIGFPICALNAITIHRARSKLHLYSDGRQMAANASGVE